MRVQVMHPGRPAFPTLRAVRAALALLAAGSIVGCQKASLCEDADGSCLTLSVTGAPAGSPIYIELLDAAGQRLKRFRTAESPEATVVAPLGKPQLGVPACVRVRSGTADARRVALLKPSAASLPDEIEVELKPVPTLAERRAITFKRLAIPLNASTFGRSATIALPPGAEGPRLVLGTSTSPAFDKGTLAFYKLNAAASGFEVDSQITPISLDMPPFPLATFPTQSGGTLAVGHSPIEMGMATGTLWPVLCSGNKYQTQKKLMPPGADYQGTSLSLNDINKDGFPDLIVNYTKGGTSGTAIVTSKQGSSGEYETRDALGATDPDTVSAATLVGQNPDGTVTFAVTLRSIVYLMNFNPSSRDAKESILLEESSPSISPLGPAVGDFDGDERPDLAVLINTKDGVMQPGQEGRLWPGTKDGTFQTSNMNTFTTLGVRPRVAIAADLNGDQIDDLVTVDYGAIDGTRGTARLSILPGGGFPLTAIPDPLQDASPRPSELMDVAVGDLNGDCKLDLVAVSKTDSVVYVLLNTTSFEVTPL